jgi:hypothetical protein
MKSSEVPAVDDSVDVIIVLDAFLLPRGSAQWCGSLSENLPLSVDIIPRCPIRLLIADILKDSLPISSALLTSVVLSSTYPQMELTTLPRLGGSVTWPTPSLSSFDSKFLSHLSFASAGVPDCQTMLVRNGSENVFSKPPPHITR